MWAQGREIPLVSVEDGECLVDLLVGHKRLKKSIVFGSLKQALDLIEVGDRQTENEKDVERDAWPVFPEEQR